MLACIGVGHIGLAVEQTSDSRHVRDPRQGYRSPTEVDVASAPSAWEADPRLGVFLAGLTTLFQKE